ncbi:MAG: transposase, partial [Prevotella sp.]|nr:transposase [Prevotella sp.]
LTNDLETEYEEIVDIYKARWAIESLFKQIKQNFPLRYFYGESANAINIQVWVTLIANLLITLLQKGVSRSWSFSGLATIVRIMLMYYIDVHGFLEHPEKDWEESLSAMMESPPEAVETEK